MLKLAKLRAWATPLTIGSFVLMAGTGILMFFDVVPGYVTFAHEWLSWIFLWGAIAHVVVNQRSFMRHLGLPWGRVSVGIFSAVLLISTFSFGQITGPQLKWPISESLVQAPISLLAELTHTSEVRLIRKLASHGIKATPGQTVSELAAKNAVDHFHVLGLIFLDDDAS